MIIVLAIFVIPWLVRTISIRETDDQLIEKLDQVYALIETNGIEVFVDTNNQNRGFGSYNILKEEYISIEQTNDTLLYEYIDDQKREIDGDVYDYRVISATIGIGNDFFLIEIGKSISTVISFESKLKSFAFYLLLALLTISIFIDLSITQYLLRPFEKIIDRLKKTDHPKHFDYTLIPTKTSDFNYLQESIAQLMHQIENAFESEREFIGNVSHELLTPISILKIKLDNFSTNSELPPQEMQKIFEAKTTLSRLTKMVRSLLLLSRIENQEYLKNESIDLASITKSIVTEFEDRAELKQQQLLFTKENQRFLYLGNTELIRILISNLISNAIKYTPEKGNIYISIEKTKNYSRLTIADSGPGINTNELPHIFERFKTFGSKKESFGIGLALVKQIAGYHNIKIQIQSSNETGTTFTLDF